MSFLKDLCLWKLITFNKELSDGLLISNYAHISSIICQRTVVDGEETFVAYTLKDVPAKTRNCSVAFPVLFSRWGQSITIGEALPNIHYKLMKHFYKSLFFLINEDIIMSEILWQTNNII